MGALNNALPFPLIFWDQTQIDSSLASILNATTAILPVVIACLSLADYALTTKEINGATLSLIGVVGIIRPSSLPEIDLGNLAQLKILSAALSYAFTEV